MKLLFDVAPGDPFSNIVKGKEGIIWWQRFIYIAISFYIIVIVLNFLIALMGDIFNRASAVFPQRRLREQLKMVLQKWEYINYIYKDEFYSLKYLIAAYTP